MNARDFRELLTINSPWEILQYIFWIAFIFGVMQPLAFIKEKVLRLS